MAPHRNQWRPVVTKRSSVPTLVMYSSMTGWRGSATSYLKIATGIMHSGWRVHAILGSETLAAGFRQAGIPAEFATFPKTTVGEANKLAGRLRSVDASVVIADTPRDMRLSVFARPLSRASVVYRYNLNYRAPNVGVVERQFLRGTAGLVFQSRAIRGRFFEAYPSLAGHPHWLIPNGYQPGTLEPSQAETESLRRSLGIPPDTLVVVCAAMLAGSKGHEWLLDVVATLHAHSVRFALVICGAGGAEERIKAHAASRGVAAIFPGFLDRSSLSAAYALADIVVHPAEREIFPNVVAEAMACGAAVIAVDSWGTAEVMGDAGILVPPGNSEALAARIIELLGDPERRERLGLRARARIRSRFSLTRMIDGYRRVLDAIVDG